MYGRDLELPLVKHDDFAVFRGGLGDGGVVVEPGQTASEIEAKKLPLHACIIFRGVEVQQADRVIGHQLDAAIIGASEVHGSDAAAVRAELLHK